MNIDLESMQPSELVALKDQIDAEMKSRALKGRETALATILSTAENSGISVRELIALLSAPKKQKNPAVVRYQDKTDKEKTWTGRGRQPKWVKEWLDSGKSLDEIAL